jgi:hypothetical protein
MTQVILKNKHKIISGELSDEELVEIKKKELFGYAEKMLNAKEVHKKRSVEFKSEIIELREQNDIYAAEYKKLKQKYNDTMNELNDIQSRLSKKKIHKVDDFNDISINNIEEEIKQVDEDAKAKYEDKRKKNMENFMKQFK